MKRRSDTAPVPSPQPRRRFGAAFLEALHESRRRQAAREIEKYSYLVDEAKANEMWRAIARSRGSATPERRSSGPIDARTQTVRVFVSQ